jgi:hypothetical protein
MRAIRYPALEKMRLYINIVSLPERFANLRGRTQWMRQFRHLRLNGSAQALPYFASLTITETNDDKNRGSASGHVSDCSDEWVQSVATVSHLKDSHNSSPASDLTKRRRH